MDARTPFSLDMPRRCAPRSYSVCSLLLAILFLLLSTDANGLTVEKKWYRLNAEFEYLVDPHDAITIDDLLRRPSEFSFLSSADSKPDAYFRPVWLRLNLSFPPEAMNADYMLIARLENIYELRVYRPDADGVYTEWVTGNNFPADSRELAMPRYGFKVPSTQEITTIYVRMIGGPGSNNLAWDLVEHEVYDRQSPAYYMLTVGCFSAILALLLFNLVIAFSLRRMDYLYYSAYVACVLMSLITMEGFGFYHLWPDHPEVNQRALHSFTLLAAATRLLAINQFLGIGALSPRLDSMSKATLGMLLLGVIIVNVWGTTNLPAFTATLPWMIGILMGYAVCIQAIRLRVRLAWTLLICLLIPTLTAVLQGMLTVNSPTVGVAEMQLAKFGFTLHVLMFSLCLAAHIKIETEARIHALHDPLTGLPGKTLLHERYAWMNALARRENNNTYLLFIDLDGFKAVNDTLGHATGDKLLEQAGERMREQLRESEFVARLGGDEFVVLITTEPETYGGFAVSRRLLKTLSSPFYINGKRINISASIGIARAANGEETLENMLQAADAAMYRAKKAGKNNFAVAQSQIAA